MNITHATMTDMFLTTKCYNTDVFTVADKNRLKYYCIGRKLN